MSISISRVENYYFCTSDNADTNGISKDWFSPEALRAQEKISKVQHGRGAVYFFEQNNQSMVLRHYRRGGLVAKVNDDKFIWHSIASSRVYRELSLLDYLQQHDFPAPKPIAGMVKKNLFSYQADILTEVIPNTKELHEILQSRELDKLVWINIGKQLKALHNLNVRHDDINVKNILLNDDDEVFVIDFDKCAIDEVASEENKKKWKADNIARFKRSLEKQLTKFSQNGQGYHYNDSDWKAIIEGYSKAF